MGVFARVHKHTLCIKQRGLKTKRSTLSSSFWAPRNLSHHMIRQARTAVVWLGGEGVKTTENKIHWTRWHKVLKILARIDKIVMFFTLYINSSTYSIHCNSTYVLTSRVRCTVIPDKGAFPAMTPNRHMTCHPLFPTLRAVLCQQKEATCHNLLLEYLPKI